MRKLGVLFLTGGGIVAALVLLALISNPLLMFILAGAVPFTTLTVPPFLMICLWILIPFILLFAPRLIGDKCWHLIELAARSIERRVRHQQSLVLERALKRPVFGLVAATYLYELDRAEAAEEAAAEADTVTKSSSRRRYATLPS